MKITRKFTIRGSEPELSLSMTPHFSGYRVGNPDITVRLCGSETIETSNGHEYKSYDGKIEMSVKEAFEFIKELQSAVFRAYPEKPALQTESK